MDLAWHIPIMERRETALHAKIQAALSGLNIPATAATIGTSRRWLYDVNRRGMSLPVFFRFLDLLALLGIDVSSLSSGKRQSGTPEIGNPDENGGKRGKGTT